MTATATAETRLRRSALAVIRTGRLNITRRVGNDVLARVTSSRDQRRVYSVTLNPDLPGGQDCTCDGHLPCAHLTALRLVIQVTP